MIDHTHDAGVTSWVRSANGHAEFPIQNLPLGVFAPGGSEARIGTAIGDYVLDLRAVAAAGLLDADLAGALTVPDLKPLLSLGRTARIRLRHRLFGLLASNAIGTDAVAPHLHEAAGSVMRLPAMPGGYTDFYAGIVHARNAGGLLRPDNPLMPNYKYVPIGYHGRTSSIRASGTDVRRPHGQIMPYGADAPILAATRRLDYELELGLWIGEGNPMGEPVEIRAAGDRIAGVTLLNDWSARDVQTWEYQPLGPFLGKNFASTVSPWLVTTEALAPFRVAQAARDFGDPPPLPYLLDENDQIGGALSIALKVELSSRRMRADGLRPQTMGRSSTTDLYWTPAQLVAHHSVNGCPLEPGDLLGTGTISGPGTDGYGSLMEMTMGGRRSFLLGSEKRTFLEDGDEVVMTGRCEKQGFAPIGLGECRAMVVG